MSDCVSLTAVSIIDMTVRCTHRHDAEAVIAECISLASENACNVVLYIDDKTFVFSHTATCSQIGNVATAFRHYVETSKKNNKNVVYLG